MLLIISSYPSDITFSHLHMEIKAFGLHRFPQISNFNLPYLKKYLRYQCQIKTYKISRLSSIKLMPYVEKQFWVFLDFKNWLLI